MEPTLRVISLGAGVQSTTMLLMALTGELPRPDCAIFADTQWEPAEVYRHLDWLGRIAADEDFPIHRVSAGNLRQSVYESKAGRRFASMPLHVRNRDGRPGMLRRQCTREYKVEPITRKLRELLGVEKGRRVPKGVIAEQWIGISTDEATRVKDPRAPWQRHRYPLIELRLSRHDCLVWLSRRGYPTPPKSACVGCPFHDDDYWRNLRDTQPEEWADAVAFDREIRQGLKGVACESFVHRSLRPLEAVDLSKPEDFGQLNLFENECEGLCGT